MLDQPVNAAIVTVLLNTNPQATLQGWGARDSVIEVDCYIHEHDHPVTIESVAEAAFFRHNVDDRPGGMACRSMSVGDVVLIETNEWRAALAVTHSGFALVPSTPFARHHKIAYQHQEEA